MEVRPQKSGAHRQQWGGNHPKIGRHVPPNAHQWSTNTETQTHKYKLLSQSDQISHILAWYGINSKSNPRQPGRVRWIKCGGQFASRFWRILRLCWLWSTLSPDFQHFSSICQSRISNQLVKDGRVLSSQPLHVLTAPRHHMHYLALRPIYFGLLGNFRNKAGILQQT